jgi:hypothetical protein
VFEGFKLRTALAVALSIMEQRGRISNGKRKEMEGVVWHRVNLDYGRALLKTGTARDKHSAAAAMFARLAVAAEENPTGATTTHDWQAATMYAMMNAGATESEGALVCADLMRMVRDAHRDADAAFAAQ